MTPRVYDPMSTLLFGYASCTGVSILYVDALRSIGVPARVTGTPAWHGGPGGASGPPQGNHNWVEVWLGADGSAGAGGGWAFIEGLPAGGVRLLCPQHWSRLRLMLSRVVAAAQGESFGNPCDKWFCAPTKGYGNGTKVFAAVYDKSSASPPGQHYPMEWEPTNKGVPGVDRTSQYAMWCNKC